mmetsp:Transcript_75464/g.221254  ORF Transcript_75464/g.221254 Transcript_75464/m.221254 type:complete len:148 (+) Transcript_75464:73-516(+)
MEMKEGDWLCPSCGDHQFKRNRVCRMCQTANPNAESPTPQEGCPWCEKGECWDHGQTDKPMKGGGKGKGKSKEGGKPGDWTCPNCGDLVFASKDTCRMCGTPRSRKGALGGFGPMKGGGKKGGGKDCKWCAKGECWTHGAGKGKNPY